MRSLTWHGWNSPANTEVARAAGPLLAEVKFEVSLLVVLYRAAPRACLLLFLRCLGACGQHGMHCPMSTGLAALRRRARRPSGRGSQAPDEGGARCRRRSPALDSQP